MSGFIPREKLTAYQRWEIAAFDEAEREAQLRAAAPPPPPVEETAGSAAEDGGELVEQPALQLPTAEEIERMHSEAYDSGYAAGHEAGYQAGLDSGRDEGYAEGAARGRDESERLAALMQELTQALTQSDQQLADQLLALAVELASQVLRHSLRVQPELILPVVREAIATLPAHHGHPLLFLHPDDAALVRSHLGEQLNHNAWRVVEDPAITAGGCRIEIGASEVDATLQSRFRRVIDTIGASSDWLAPPR